MPLLINVGLNRKASKDFQSVGVSLNLTAELDQGLLSDPPRLQSEIDRIYGQAEEALERQISAMGTEAKQDAQPAHHAAPQPIRSLPSPQNGHTPPVPASNDKPISNGFAQGGPVRPATESQMRALRAICKRGRLDLDREAHDEFGLESSDQLDVKQASQLIDILKERQGQPSPQRRWG
jgi:hypothetical protein